MSGAIDLLMLVGDRSRMFVPLPGWPLGTTVTPAIFPWIVSSAFVAGMARSHVYRPTVKERVSPRWDRQRQW